MTFQNIVCWNYDMIGRVMNVEATQPDNHLFLATHYSSPMYRQDLIKADISAPYDEEKFIRDFLAEKDFAFVPVLGRSGTGKSHLIRWLAANIKSTNKRKVLLIPKVGTNLKDIISLILEGMEGERFNEYRQRLNKATNTLTENQACEQLLNQLAAAVGNNGKHNLSQLSEAQIYLVKNLNSLLYDPFFRQHWLIKGGIIHRLVIHIIGHRDTVEIIDERREFSIDDLPHNILDHSKAGKQAKDFYGFLINNDEIQKATVDWLNSHLDEAITQVLNLGREDLQRLMREVREALAEQGIELVLLIEDFAKLQGIDRELLEAVLARPQQPGSKSLCAIRTALACTTGYFEGLIDTVKQRITFSINLNIDIGNDKNTITQTDIQKFVVRYLNAIRLEEKEIEDWASSNQEGEQREPLKSACTECEYRLDCHAGFADVDGIGLYPFTPKALEQMLNRVNPGDFNPRIIIKDLLKYTLENASKDIKKGDFPNITIKQHFGKMKLSAMLQEDIKANDRQNYERRQILLDLWADTNELCNLPPEIHTAFNLPSLGIKIKQTEIKQVLPPENNPSTPHSQELAGKYTPNPQPLVIPTPDIPDVLKNKIEILNNWNNQEILPDKIAQEIRGLIFPAINEKIEWDIEMLLKGTFVGAGGKLFRQDYVTFYSPKVKRTTYSGVILSLPLNPNDSDEFRNTTIAFQGILQYNHYKNWKFPNGDRYFRHYSNYLERWSQYVVEQIRLYPRKSGEPWNPVPAAVELLGIAATMSGHPTNSPENLMNSLFRAPNNKEDATRVTSWRKLLSSLNKYHAPLLEIIKSRTACTKGSYPTFQIIDAMQIIEPWKQVSKSWRPQSSIPEDVIHKFPELQKARQQVDELLELAIQEEANRQLSIYQNLVSEMGEDIKKKHVVDIVKQAMEAAQEAGVFRGNFDDITTVLDRFKSTRFSGYAENMKRVQKEREAESKSGKLLQYLSEDYQKAMTDASEFLADTGRFLDASLNEVQSCINDLEKSDGTTVELSHQEIQEGLASLRSLITEIKGETL